MTGGRSRSSLELFGEARRVFPGGVNSPVRAAIRPYPFYVERGDGAYIYTVDGEKLIDLVLGYGPMILGHGHPRVVRAVEEQLARGWLYGAPHEAELLLAKKILSHVMPGGMVRFVNSGSEAVATALRLARGYTRRDYIIKFDGCYHGAVDYVLVGAGSAAAHYGVPTSEGVPRAATSLTLVARYNDVNSVEKVVRSFGDRIAAIIVEPVVANLGVIPPREGFLRELRRLADDAGALLIFDEVVTGFRLSMGGAQEYYGVKADVVVLGKIIGGGFPIGAVVARRDIMEMLTPSGKVFNAGTFNAHPVSMVAGLATLEVLEEENVHYYARVAMDRVVAALRDAAEDSKTAYSINRVESMAQIFFTDREVVYPEDARSSDAGKYLRFHEEARRNGVFVAPSQFEALFTGLPHRGEVLEELGQRLYESLRSALKGR